MDLNKIYGYIYAVILMYSITNNSPSLTTILPLIHSLSFSLYFMFCMLMAFSPPTYTYTISCMCVCVIYCSRFVVVAVFFACAKMKNEKGNPLKQLQLRCCFFFFLVCLVG